MIELAILLDFVCMNSNPVLRICILLIRHEIVLVNKHVYLFSHLLEWFFLFSSLGIYSVWYSSHELTHSTSMCWHRLIYPIYVLQSFWSMTFVSILHCKCYWLVYVEVVFFCKLTICDGFQRFKAVSQQMDSCIDF